MMSSRPTNAPPQMNRMFVVSTWMYCCSGCFRPPCGGTLHDGAFEHLQEGLLDALAAHVTGDRHVAARLADLVDLVDVDDPVLGRLHVEIGGVQQLEDQVLHVLADVARPRSKWWRRRWRTGTLRMLGQRPGEQRLARPGRAEQRMLLFYFFITLLAEIAEAFLLGPAGGPTSPAAVIVCHEFLLRAVTFFGTTAFYLGGWTAVKPSSNFTRLVLR
jgi:hypothetical protein